MPDTSHRIDARLYHCGRHAYACSLVQRSLVVTDSIQATAERCGLTRQYLHALMNGERVLSYATQVALEQIVDATQGRPLVEVDAPCRMRRKPEDAVRLVQMAILAAGGVAVLSQRTGVSRQFIHALQTVRRRYRYPFQVLLEAVIAEAHALA